MRSRGSRSAARNALLEALVVASLAGACAPGAEIGGATEARAEIGAPGSDGTSPIAPIGGSPIPRDDPRAALGRDLFFDPILSRDGRVICNDCHDLSRAGTDGLVHSELPDRAPGPVNVPSIFNLAWAFRFSWSGRFEQMQGVLDIAMTSPSAMGTTWPDAVHRLATSPPHRAAFERVYGAGPTEDRLREVLERFVLTLTTPDAPFDRWLLGDEDAIDQEAIEGYALFREYGCASCHQGVGVGGNLYQRFGIMRDYFADRGGLTDADLGLYRRTEREEDRHVFRVPSLRNVALTAPYFHDGSAATLEQAVETMARYQLGRPIPVEHRTSIVRFLETLTGRLDVGGATSAHLDRASRRTLAAR